MDVVSGVGSNVFGDPGIYGNATGNVAVNITTNGNVTGTLDGIQTNAVDGATNIHIQVAGSTITGGSAGGSGNGIAALTSGNGSITVTTDAGTNVTGNLAGISALGNGTGIVTVENLGATPAAMGSRCSHTASPLGRSAKLNVVVNNEGLVTGGIGAVAVGNGTVNVHADNTLGLGNVTNANASGTRFGIVTLTGNGSSTVTVDPGVSVNSTNSVGILSISGQFGDTGHGNLTVTTGDGSLVQGNFGGILGAGRLLAAVRCWCRRAAMSSAASGTSASRRSPPAATPRRPSMSASTRPPARQRASPARWASISRPQARAL